MCPYHTIINHLVGLFARSSFRWPGETPGRGSLILAQVGGMGCEDKMEGMEGCGKNMGAMMDTDKDGKVSLQGRVHETPR